MARLLFLLAVSAPFAVAVMGDLNKELLNEGLVSLNEDGVLTTTCMVSLQDGSTTVQTCPVAPGFGPKGVACFAVWNGKGFMQQGCYSNQEISLRDQCQKKTCHAHRKTKGVSFCCCHGPLCNADYSQA